MQTSKLKVNFQKSRAGIFSGSRFHFLIGSFCIKTCFLKIILRNQSTQIIRRWLPWKFNIHKAIRNTLHDPPSFWLLRNIWMRMYWAFLAFWSTLISICQTSPISLCGKSCDFEGKYVVFATAVSQKRRRQPIYFILTLVTDINTGNGKLTLCSSL